MNLLPKHGELTYLPSFLSIVEAGTSLALLSDSIEWKSETITLFGKKIPMPRLTAWYGNPEAIYTYSGLKNIPLPWTPELLFIKERAEETTQTTFNSVLLNFYRDGNDHMSWHADDEKSLGDKPVIASVSLGEKRKFGLKHRFEEGLKLNLELESGSLLIMKGEMQEFWHHRIFPSKKPLGARINLTFRNVISY